MSRAERTFKLEKKMLLCYQRTRWTRFVHLGVLHQTIGVKKKMVSSMMPPRASESSNVFQFDALPATPAERSAPYLTSRAQLSEVAIRIVEVRTHRRAY